ncbi:sugar-transfer associated ATP-grasp domain-containing protein [Kineobactrum salinum]|uniref:Alpha-L-glutamate ligase-related protein ATP-grasp domain-containing protein n=1 Tax=Kineobactrum salinum TaxID=2708301 RepID=A0A6C0U5J2_9GAMM|nr:sugar-transfer associated ATP-grasp domain-containing protein [Kineobactrum salinum]QIB64714.1 hypothetical protein G3T16_04220 [Kineobactrum salinum]
MAARRLMAIFSMLREEARLADIPLRRLLWQTARFCLKTGLGPRYFVVAGMARKEFAEADKWQHISARQYYRALDRLNPPLYRKLTQNKLAEKALYQLLQIPSARLLAYFSPRRGLDQMGGSLADARQLQQMLGQLAGQTICLKPVEGWGGTGVMIGKASMTEGTPVFCPLHSAQSLTAEDLVASFSVAGKLPEFVIEEYLQQSEEFAAFNPASVNTLRIWVLEFEPGRTEVIGAYLRVGRAGSAIDNASAGGIMCPVDIDTGMLQTGLTKHTPHRQGIVRHPDHQAKLAGQTLSQWPEIVRLSCDVLSKLPQTRFAGLDITMTPAGPVVVEANVAPDKDGAAHANIASRRILSAVSRLHG